MPRYIDADAIKYTARFTDYADGRMTSDAIVTKDEIDGLPTADVVEIVRCKDCVVHTICRYKTGLGDNGFCSQGKRREDA